MSVKRAGLIRGNPECGLNFRECIEVTKVLDGCITKLSDITFVIHIEQSSAPYPYTLLSVRSSGETAVTNVLIFPHEGRQNEGRQSRISFDSLIPVSVLFRDADGREHSAGSTVSLHREVLLKLPENSLTPYEFKATTSLVSELGAFLSPTEISARCCVMQVSKVAVTVDLLVPSYGYCEYPECRESGLCEAINDLPLFPPFL